MCCFLSTVKVGGGAGVDQSLRGGERRREQVQVQPLSCNRDLRG
jgi:hypothetical protein